MSDVVALGEEGDVFLSLGVFLTSALGQRASHKVRQETYKNVVEVNTRFK